jgi:hypothetical protein
MKVYGPPAGEQNAGGPQQNARWTRPEPTAEPTLRGDEPMVDPTPTL